MADVQIPMTYKAAVYDKPGEVSSKVTELETPEPGPGEVLVHLYVLGSLTALRALSKLSMASMAP
jgi:hypothetical protein